LRFSSSATLPSGGPHVDDGVVAVEGVLDALPVAPKTHHAKGDDIAGAVMSPSTS